MLLSTALIASLAPIAPSTPIETYPNVPTLSVPSQASALDDGLRAIDVYLGLRALDEDDWDPVDQQAVLGAQFVMQSNSAPVGFEIGFLASSDEDDVGGVDLEATLLELYGGVHKSFGTAASSLRPYVGAGLTVMNAEVEGSSGGSSVSDDDTSAGLYLHGGLAFNASSALRLGVDLRLVTGTDMDFNLGGVSASGDADYGQLALMVGFRL